nr:hypothetical protein 2 [bacterium]
MQKNSGTYMSVKFAHIQAYFKFLSFKEMLWLPFAHILFLIEDLTYNLSLPFFILLILSYTLSLKNKKTSLFPEALLLLIIASYLIVIVPFDKGIDFSNLNIQTAIFHDVFTIFPLSAIVIGKAAKHLKTKKMIALYSILIIAGSTGIHTLGINNFLQKYHTSMDLPKNERLVLEEVLNYIDNFIPKQKQEKLLFIIETPPNENITSYIDRELEYKPSVSVKQKTKNYDHRYALDAIQPRLEDVLMLSGYKVVQPYKKQVSKSTSILTISKENIFSIIMAYISKEPPSYRNMSLVKTWQFNVVNTNIKLHLFSV